MYEIGEGVLQDYEPTTRPADVGAPAADTVANSPADLETDSANPALPVREPEAGAGRGATSPYFTRGSHRDDVLRIQGTPLSINRFGEHEVWWYGLSTIDISLRDERVTEWSNQGNLKVRMDAGTGPGEWGGIGGSVFRVGCDVSAPQVVFKVDPAYSEQARKAKHEGTVVLNLVVQRDGLVRNVRVVQSLGLDEKAIEAVQKWRFRPGMKSGEPVDVAAIVEVTFRLL